MIIEDILAGAPQNFVIRNALEQCYYVVQEHNNIMCSISGGSDSDVMLDMLIRCGASDKTDFVFFDTGIEYSATRQHLDYLEEKYGIRIKREQAAKPVPVSVKEYGQPFWSKYVSEMIQRLQYNNFKWEDRPFEELILEYPRCKTALRTEQYVIKRSPGLKEYIMAHPPKFKVSDYCCKYAKKKVSEKYQKKGDFDLVCTGLRQSEGGIRSAYYKTCFSQKDGTDSFRPVFYLSDNDKQEYCEWYHVAHSRCYSEYGLKRTGCFGCPFGKRFEDELSSIKFFEPKLYAAANHIFGDSYEYTRNFLAFRKEMQKKNA